MGDPGTNGTGATTVDSRHHMANTPTGARTSVPDAPINMNLHQERACQNKKRFLEKQPPTSTDGNTAPSPQGFC